jgi:hypothetical protein
VSQDSAEVVVHVAAKCDGDNKGLSAKELKARLHDMNPHLSLKQITNSWRKTVHPQAKKAKILTGTIIANATTSKRSAVTVQQQFRWHTLIDEGDKFIASQNIVRYSAPAVIQSSFNKSSFCALSYL